MWKEMRGFVWGWETKEVMLKRGLVKVLLARERKGLPDRTNSMFKRVKVGYSVMSLGYGLSVVMWSPSHPIIWCYRSLGFSRAKSGGMGYSITEGLIVLTLS